MVDKLYKKMHLPPELEQPELSTDLEWMLTSSQISAAMIIESIIREHLASLYRVAFVMVGNDHQADLTVRDTLIGVVANRHRYRSREGARPWLFQLLVDICQRSLPRSENHKYPMDASSGENILASSPGLEIHREADLWRILDESDFQTRLLMVLYYLYDFSPSEIAWILRIPEAEVQPLLEKASWWLHLFKPDSVSPGEKDEAWIKSSLERHWPRINLTETDQKRMVDAALASLDLHERHKRVVKLFQQIVSVITVVILIVIVGWLSNNLFRKKPQRLTVFVTQTSLPIPSTRIPTIIQTYPREFNNLLAPRSYIQPLTLSSSPDEIRLKMSESSRSWGIIKVSGVIIHYGQPGYDGPLPVYRNQMWISNPNQAGQSEERMVISGPEDSAPVYAMMMKGGSVYEAVLPDGILYDYPLGEFNPFYGNYNPAYLGIYGFDNRGMMDGSFLASMLFAAGPVSVSGRLKVSGIDQILGREVLIVDNEQSGMRDERLWVDAYTGMILRWQGYGGPDKKVLLAEIIVDDLQFDTQFPVDLFYSAIFTRSFANWRAFEVSSFIKTPAVTPDLRRLDVRKYLPPPQKYDPSKSCLTFQWEPGSSKGETTSQMAQIFADGFYLGKISMGDPWLLKCKRSSDGSLIACLNSPPGLESAVYASSNLFWFALSDLKTIDNVFSGAPWISSDFAFSPDSSSLAFWGCREKRERCGIFLQDTRTRETKELLSLASGAASFTWSPDGEYLSFMVDRQDSTYTPGYIVVRIASGEIVYNGLIIEKNLALLADIPTFPWGMNPYVTGAGLNRCIQTQE